MQLVRFRGQTYAFVEKDFVTTHDKVQIYCLHVNYSATVAWVFRALKKFKFVQYFKRWCLQYFLLHKMFEFWMYMQKRVSKKTKHALTRESFWHVVNKVAAPSEMKKQTPKDANVNFNFIFLLTDGCWVLWRRKLAFNPRFFFEWSEIKFTSRVNDLLEVASFLCKVQSSLAIGWYGGAGNGQVPGTHRGCDKGSSGGSLENRVVY